MGKANFLDLGEILLAFAYQGNEAGWVLVCDAVAAISRMSIQPAFPLGLMELSKGPGRLVPEAGRGVSVMQWGLWVSFSG